MISSGFSDLLKVALGCGDLRDSLRDKKRKIKKELLTRVGLEPTLVSEPGY